MIKNDRIQGLLNEMSTTVVGNEKEIKLLTIALLFNGHVLFESVPGTGKTLIAKTFATATEGTFSRIQFTPDVLPSDITGIQFFNPSTKQFELKVGPIVSNIVLADEINRATPRTQSAMLEVMEERQVTIDGITVKVEEPFMVIATQNPIESQQGTYLLPAAQLDRFFFKIPLAYPSLENERNILQMALKKKSQSTISSKLTKEEINQLKQEVSNVTVSNDMETYILEIIRKTREFPAIDLGVSPRGAITLMRAAQGNAYLNNRNYVIPEDIIEMVPYCLAHRIELSTSSSLTKDEYTVLEELLETVSVPVEWRA